MLLPRCFLNDLFITTLIPELHLANRPLPPLHRHSLPRCIASHKPPRLRVVLIVLPSQIAGVGQEEHRNHLLGHFVLVRDLHCFWLGGREQPRLEWAACAEHQIGPVGSCFPRRLSLTTLVQQANVVSVSDVHPWIRDGIWFGSSVFVKVVEWCCGCVRRTSSRPSHCSSCRCSALI